MEAKKGMIVRSKAGHDKGRFMMITAAEGDFVLLADGKERKLSHPKRKRLKHIEPTNTLLTEQDLKNITDKRLRAITRGILEKDTEEV